MMSYVLDCQICGKDSNVFWEGEVQKTETFPETMTVYSWLKSRREIIYTDWLSAALCSNAVYNAVYASIYLPEKKSIFCEQKIANTRDYTVS